jgi:hypothetical protein
MAMYEPRVVYDALFAATWQTVAVFAKDEKHLNAQAGMIAVLHTWGQNPSLHLHLHGPTIRLHSARWWG